MTTPCIKAGPIHGTPQKIDCTHITYWQYHALQAGDTHTYTQIRQNICGAFIDNDDVTLAHALFVSFLMLLCTPMFDLPNSHWQCSQPLLAGKYKTFGNGDLAAGHCKSKKRASVIRDCLHCTEIHSSPQFTVSPHSQITVAPNLLAGGWPLTQFPWPCTDRIKANPSTWHDWHRRHRWLGITRSLCP